MTLIGNIKGLTGLTGSVASYTVAELKAATTPPTLIYINEGGKKGLFRLDVTDTTTPNDDAMCIVRGTDRYKRDYYGAVDVRWFGAKGDGVTDDTVAIQNAIDANLYNYNFAPTGAFYKIVGEIVLNNPCNITGSHKKQGSSIVQYANNKSIFRINKQFCEISNLNFVGNTTVGTVAIEVNESNSTVKNCWFENFDKGISTPISANNTNENNYYENRIINCNHGLHIQQGNINTRFSKNTVSGCKSAIYIKDTAAKPHEGLNISDSLIYACGDSSTPAIYVEDANFINFTNVMLDFCVGVPIHLNNSQFTKMNDCYISSNSSVNQNGLELTNNCSDFTANNTQFFDCRKYGVELTGSSSMNIIFNLCTFNLNTAGDIMNNGCKDVEMNSCILKSTTSVVVLDNDGANPNIKITNGKVLGNIIRGNAMCGIEVIDCSGWKTKKKGIAVIGAGDFSVDIPSDLSLVSFQDVVVNATSSSVESISAVFDSANNKIILQRAGNIGTLAINYIAEVCN